MAKIYGSDQNDDGEWHWYFFGFSWHPDLVGTDENDEIYGYKGDDDLFGMDGDDYLDGGEGADYMNGGWGNDIYVVDNVGDHVDDNVDLYDGEGNLVNSGHDIVISHLESIYLYDYVGIEDLVLAEGSQARYGVGNTLDNVITGNAHDNGLAGDDGEDTLYGMDGDDELDGDDGDDWLYGGRDNDTLKGGIGNDHLYGGSHGDSLFGGDDNDVLDGGTGGDSMRGEGGDDDYWVDNALDQVIEAVGQGSDKVFASVSFTLAANVEDLVLLDGYGAINGTGNGLGNEILGNDSNNTLSGLGGADELWGFEGEDTLNGGDGEDVLRGGTQDDTLNGNNQRDVLFGDDGDDLLNGGADNDTLYGLDDDDELIGGTGNDVMYGNTGNDIYWVQDAGDLVSEVSWEHQGVDTVHSLLNDYTLTVNVENLILEALARNGTGNGLSNRINGNGFDNTINGGLGNDFLLGGNGADIFAFNTLLGTGANANIDTIWDFDTASDTIQLDNAVFTALKGDGRSLTFAEFRVGSGALDASDRVIYNNQTGALLYDADGTGAQAALQFATLDAGLGVTQADFWIV